LAFAALAGGCARDPVKEEIDRRARDHERLADVVAADQELDRELKEADDASQGGDDAKAAALLDRDANKAADDAIAEAEHAPLESVWGRARRDELLAVIHARKDEIKAYADALRGDDLDKKLAAVEKQLELQKRAITATETALAAPPPP
jgi:hypothetical protein